MDFENFEYIITDIIILSEIFTSIFIMSKHYSIDFDKYDEKIKNNYSKINWIIVQIIRLKFF